MNNDLKSSEALKAYAREVLCGNNPTNSLLIRMFDEIIDNAPTVFSCNACKNMGNEQECVDCHDYSNYVHYDERPQGEWFSVSERLPEITSHYLNMLIYLT